MTAENVSNEAGALGEQTGNKVDILEGEGMGFRAIYRMSRVHWSSLVRDNASEILRMACKKIETQHPDDLDETIQKMGLTKKEFICFRGIDLPFN